jgi:hypothetical protein
VNQDPDPEVRCRVASLAAGEPMPGTAPHAVGWLVLEQPGPWGARAWTASRLDPGLGARVEAACAVTSRPVRPMLVRRPDGTSGDTRTVLLAHTVPGATWLLGAEVPAERLADLPWEALAVAVAAGDADVVRRELPGCVPVPPLLLVCTNGKRDRCCAIEGRPVAVEVAAARPGRCWETIHLGGHRFAPTAAVLPAGALHGRLTARSAQAVLDAAERGEVVLEDVRGRSTWAPPGQAAEAAVRAELGERDADALRVETDEGDQVTVHHRDGRAWAVEVRQEERDDVRPESCGKAALPVRAWVAGTPRAVQPSR